MLSIQLNSIELTCIIWINWSLWPRFTNEEGSCITISQILTSGGLYRVGWKCCRFNLIRSNRHESYESTEVCCHVLRMRKVHVSLFHGSWLPVVRIDPCKSSWIVKCLRWIDTVWVYWTWMKGGGGGGALTGLLWLSPSTCKIPPHQAAPDLISGNALAINQNVYHRVDRLCFAAQWNPANGISV